MPTTVISGFASGDTIDLTGISTSEITGVSLGAGNVLQIATNDHGTLNLQLAASDTFNGQFISAADGAGTDIFFANNSDITVTSGQTSNGLVISAGQTLTVLSGGTTSGTILSGGTENVFGTEQSATVSNGGQLNVDAGGIAHDLFVSSGGTLNVAGIITSNTTVFSGATENILYGGDASGAVGSGTKISGGTVNLQSGGLLDHSTVFAGGILNVAGTVTSNIAISAGGIENVLSGGLTSGSSSRRHDCVVLAVP